MTGQVTWRSAPIPRPPEEAAFVLRVVLLTDGRLLATGGSVSATLDPGSATWSDTRGRMLVPRREHAVVTMEDGRVLAAGGIGEEGITGECELFDPANGTWRRAPPLPAPRRGLAAVVVPGGRVLAIGGTDRTRYGSTAVTAWTPGTEEWMAMPSLCISRREPVACVLEDGSVVAMELETAERWDPEIEGWTEIRDGAYKRGAAMSPWRDGVAFAGGEILTTAAARALTRVDVWTPGAGWSKGLGLGAGRAEATAIPFEGSRVLLAGGYRFYERAPDASETEDDEDRYSTPQESSDAADVTLGSPEAGWESIAAPATGQTAAFALPERTVVIVSVTGPRPAAHIARL